MPRERVAEKFPAEIGGERLGQAAVAPHLSERCEIEHARRGVRFRREKNSEERQQHRDAANHRVNEELRRGGCTLRPAPKPHEEERRNQTQLPENEPVKKVQRRERAE